MGGGASGGGGGVAGGPAPGATGGGESPGVFHRGIEALEQELLENINRREVLLEENARRGEQINALSLQRSKTPLQERDQISGRIEQLNNAIRTVQFEISRLSLIAEKIRLEIDRFERESTGMRIGGGAAGKAPAPGGR